MGAEQDSKSKGQASKVASFCERCIYFENRYTYSSRTGGNYFGVCTWGHKIRRSKTKEVQRTQGYKRICSDFDPINHVGTNF